MSDYVEKAREGCSDADIGGRDRKKDYVAPGMGKYTLLPGDPDRIDLMTSQWDSGSAKTYNLIRGHRSATGTYHGAQISAFSTGVGGASLEPSFTTLVSSGIDTFIRVGTTGTIQENICVGDIIINDSCVRLDGTSRLYVRDEYPAAADPVVTMALMQACENLKFVYHVGTGCTSASFYCGQCRPAYGGYKPGHLDGMFNDFRQARVLNFEMEAATILTLGRIFGVRAGMCAVVVANRITGEWNDRGMSAKACLAGAEAVRILQQWDERQRASGQRYFTPDLLRAGGVL